MVQMGKMYLLRIPVYQQEGPETSGLAENPHPASGPSGSGPSAGPEKSKLSEKKPNAKSAAKPPKLPLAWPNQRRDEQS